MDTLTKLITDLSKEEIRFFKLYINRTQDSSDRKDVMLFDYIRKSSLTNSYDEDFILDKLYKQNNKNAFYRLKNRLLTDINTSLYLQHYEKYEETQILHFISMAKFYHSRNDNTLCFSFLRKAEQKAELSSNYELLQLIYNEFIRLSTMLSDINAEEYLEKRRINQNIINKNNQINEILARVRSKLLQTENFSTGNTLIFPLIKKTVDEISNDNQLKNSSEFRFKIYETVSKILLEKKDYLTLEVFLLTSFLQFSEDRLFNKTTHSIKLQILSGFIETLYHNQKYERAISYIHKLREAMIEFDGLHYDDYVFTYHNSLIKNYAAFDHHRAIELLERLKTDKEFNKIPDNEIYIFLSLAIIWYEKRDFHKAIANIYKLYMYDSYTRTGDELKYKAVVTELIIRYELQDFEYIVYRSEQLKDEFKTYLSQNKWEKEFIEIMHLQSKNNSIEPDKPLMKRMKQFPNEKTEKFNEIKYINYANWLRQKFFAPSAVLTQFTQ